MWEAFRVPWMADEPGSPPSTSTAMCIRSARIPATRKSSWRPPRSAFASAATPEHRGPSNTMASMHRTARQSLFWTTKFWSLRRQIPLQRRDEFIAGHLDRMDTLRQSKMGYPLGSMASPIPVASRPRARRLWSLIETAPCICPRSQAGHGRAPAVDYQLPVAFSSVNENVMNDRAGMLAISAPLREIRLRFYPPYSPISSSSVFLQDAVAVHASGQKHKSTVHQS